MRLLLSLIFLLLCNAAFANDDVYADLPNRDSIPQVFWFDGNPIDPNEVIFDGDSSRFNPRHLNPQFYLMQPNISLKANDSRYFKENGFYGYYYDDISEPSPNPPYQFYKYIGELHGLHILWTEEGGGGSGQFHDLIGVARDGDTVQLKQEFTGGDREYHDLDYANVDGGTLNYGIMLSPADFLMTFADSDVQKKFVSAYISSAGFDNMAEGHYSDGKMIKIDVLKIGSPSKYRKKDLSLGNSLPQQCFEKFIQDETGGQVETLNLQEYQSLIARFFAQCMKP
jgi:hypothetical protein